MYSGRPLQSQSQSSYGQDLAGQAPSLLPEHLPSLASAPVRIELKDSTYQDVLESLAAEARALKRLRALYADESTRIRREGLVLKAVLQDELQAREDAALFPLPGAGGGNVDVASSSSSGSSLQTPSIRAVGKGSAPPSSSAAPRRAGGAGRSGAARRGGGQGVGGTESGIESGYDGAGEEMGVAAAVAMTDVDDDALLQELQAEAERRENAREEGR